MPDFAGGRFPVADTCDGGDHPPTVTWGQVPAGAAELYLDLYDPDAGGFSHWVVVAIPTAAMGLPPLPGGARSGVNGFGTAGYRGPCPPRAQDHHYVLEVGAVDRPLALPAQPRRSDLRHALAAVRVVALGTATATYRR